MVQTKPSTPRDPSDPPLRPRTTSARFLIGTDSHGRWVVRDQAGLHGGLFVSRAAALRFAMREIDGRPQAVTMVPGILEFCVGRPADLPDIQGRTHDRGARPRRRFHRRAGSAGRTSAHG